MRIDGVFIELVAADPDRLATFYERLASLERTATPTGTVLLRGPGVTLAIRRGADPEPDARNEGPVVGFVVSGEPQRLRDELAASGAVVLSESKREGQMTLHCCDPVGNEFAVYAAADATPTPDGPSALVVAQRRSGDHVDPPAAAQAPPQRPSAQPRITRRDVDRLRDMERLAQMQEAIAGLHVGFTPDDPGGILDEMRAKVGPGFSTHEAEERDALLRVEQREAEAESLLERYKREAHGVAPEPPAAPGDAAHPADDGNQLDVGRMRRSLGGSADADE
jgi:hypothetical protein